MFDESSKAVPQDLYHPFTDKCMKRMWVAAAAIALLGTLIAWIGRLGPGAVAISLSVLLVMAPIADILARAYRNRRRRAFTEGEVLEGIVVKKTTSPMGPVHRLTVEYSVRGCCYRSSSIVAFERWLPYHIGDKVRIRVAPSDRRYWVLSPADPFVAAN